MLLLKRLQRRLDSVVCVVVDGEISSLVGHLKLRLDLGRHPGEDGLNGHAGGSVVGDAEATGRKG